MRLLFIKYQLLRIQIEKKDQALNRQKTSSLKEAIYVSSI